jgi:hypothetical protein
VVRYQTALRPEFRAGIILALPELASPLPGTEWFCKNKKGGQTPRLTTFIFIE